MNVAVVIGVSNYLNTSANLPGCLNDAALMINLLNCVNKYDEILVITHDNTSSIKVKSKLSNFFSDKQSTKIDEVFFYYTGHGQFFENEFYYTLSDFDETQRRQTSLTNNELDNWIRQLNPSLTVKVIDACHSGAMYIKDDDVFSKYLDESKKGFNKCYFLFSSMLEQFSYQTNFSYFTKSFIEAVLKYSSLEIRYKDIIDYISDDFEKNYLQTPFFVSQANFTEKFGLISSDLKSTLSLELGNKDSQENKLAQESHFSLEEVVKRDAQGYCTKKEVVNNINALKTFIETYQYSSDFSSLYNITSSFEDSYNSEFSVAPIGKWLEDNHNEYFAKPTYEQRAIKSKADETLLIDISLILNKRQYETYISGFHVALDIPFKLVEIYAKSKYPNINHCCCIIVFVFSKTNIRFFYFYSHYKELDWDCYQLERNYTWQSIDTKMKDFEAIKSTMSLVLDNFDAFVLKPIKTKYKLVEDEEQDISLS